MTTLYIGAFGLRPIYHPSGLPRPRRMLAGIPSAYGTAIYNGQPVAIATGGGSIVPVAANNVDFVGVFAGCEYTPSGGRPGEFVSWTAGTVLDASQTLIAYYYDDPQIVYEVQTDGGTVYTQTIIGGQINLTNFAANGAGYSQATVGGAQVAAAAQGQLRVVDLHPDVDNAIGDTYLNLQVMIARHQYLANKVAP